MSRSNPFSTSNNPFTQGGWSEGQPAAGAASPTNSSQSSNSSSSGSGSDWHPAQSSYGALPMSTSSGVVLTPIGSQYSTFRFVSQGSPANLVVISPNNSMAYRVRSNDTVTVIYDHLGQQIATLQWPGGTLPYVERNGRRVRLSEWMTPVAGTQMRRMAAGQRTVFVSFNAQNINFHLSDNLTEPPIAELGNEDAGCVLRVHSGLSAQADRQELLNCLVIATVALQSRAFVGLN
ncbi:hypothetical protein SCHPADRAFT_996516 [Schizopora paradoxa]|uniref:Uncharacterized protein n=1 Tax=Schizopora paradoxa TaxID=27342 RepID=A0A0H2RRD2_9AGAM|nr:hypothetical protein SCHPADRAFT_996516 [Schizopora paradoxa]